MSRRARARSATRAEAQQIRPNQPVIEFEEVEPHSAELANDRTTNECADPNLRTQLRAGVYGSTDPGEKRRVREKPRRACSCAASRDPDIASMSGQIVPKRFGLKYSPKPAIALEYQKPDSGVGGKERKKMNAILCNLYIDHFLQTLCTYICTV